MAEVSNRKFYDSLSAFYDSMVNSRKSIKSKKELFRNFITEDMKNAADIGCGSGNDSIALAMNGLRVTGFDSSAEMIKLAKKNAAALGQKISLVNCRTDGIPERYSNKFDITVSMGNTFANIEPKLLAKSVKKIHHILSKNGMLLLQVVNYYPVIKNKKRILNITKDRYYTFIRFYDFLGEKIRFNILSISNSDSSNYTLNSTILYPYGKELLTQTLMKAGFRDIRFYSGLNKGKYEKQYSNDLVIEAIK